MFPFVWMYGLRSLAIRRCLPAAALLPAAVFPLLAAFIFTNHPRVCFIDFRAALQLHLSLLRCLHREHILVVSRLLSKLMLDVARIVHPRKSDLHLDGSERHIRHSFTSCYGLHRDLAVFIAEYHMLCGILDEAGVSADDDLRSSVDHTADFNFRKVCVLYDVF